MNANYYHNDQKMGSMYQALVLCMCDSVNLTINKHMVGIIIIIGGVLSLSLFSY